MTNLKQLISSTPLKMIFLSSWFEKNGISSKSVHDHKKYGWLDVIGRGAFIKKGIEPELIAGINAVQTQTSYKLHIGGRYALDQYHNVRHYLRNDTKMELFSSEQKPLPQWFRDTFKNKYIRIRTSFLPDDLGFQEYVLDGLKLKISSPERALLEMLYVSDISTKEAYQIFESMTVIKPNLLNDLLIECKSVKIKRLFMYLASQTGYSWVKKLHKDKIDFGSGVRVIDKTGYFNKEYNIIVDRITEE